MTSSLPAYSVLRESCTEIAEAAAAEIMRIYAGDLGVRNKADKSPVTDADNAAEAVILAGLRMHYLDEGPRDAPRTWLCLHGNPAWSYLYRRMLPALLAAGDRVVAPDLIGFGKSDKPKKEGAHQFEWHRQVLLELVERLDLRNVVLVVQDWGGILGLTLPMAMPDRFGGLLVMNTLLATGDAPLPQGFVDWRAMCRDKPLYGVGRLLARGNPHLSPAECAAYDAPFPDKGYRAALRAFPERVPPLWTTPARRCRVQPAISGTTSGKAAA